MGKHHPCELFLANASDERKLFRVPSMQLLGRIDGSATFYSAGKTPQRP